MEDYRQLHRARWLPGATSSGCCLRRNGRIWNASAQVGAPTTFTENRAPVTRRRFLIKSIFYTPPSQLTATSAVPNLYEPLEAFWWQPRRDSSRAASQQWPARPCHHYHHSSALRAAAVSRIYRDTFPALGGERNMLKSVEGIAARSAKTEPCRRMRSLFHCP